MERTFTIAGKKRTNGIIHGIVANRKDEPLLSSLFSSSAVRLEPYAVRNPFSTFSFLKSSAWKIINAIKNSGTIDNALIFMYS